MSLNGEIIDNGDAGAQDEERRRQFKNAGKTKDEMRRRRVEENIEIRKAKRDDTMMKRRNVDLDNLVSSPESPESKAAESHVFTDPIAEVKAAAEGLQSTEPTRRFNNLQRLRKVLSRESHPPIDLVIEAGLLPRIVELLGDPCEKTQFEAAWALTNVASGTSAHTQAVIDVGAVPPLLQLFAKSTSQDVAEQALWGLGNIVGDGPRNRDAIIQAGIVPILMQHLKKPNLPRTFVKNIAWMISNLTRGKNPAPNFQVVSAFLPALAAMLESKDMECMVDSAWSLSYLSDGSEEQIEAVIEAGAVPPMVKLMQSSRDPRLLTPCVRTIGNVVTGSDAQTDAAVGCDVLPAVVPILDMPKSGLVKEACWLISNIAAGNHGQIQAVLNSGAMPKIISIMRHGEYRCQKEAAWVVTNVMAGGTGEQIRTLCEAEVIPPLCELMKTQDIKFVLIILDAVGSLLAAAQKNNFLEAAIAAIEECGGLDTLETMQNHENEEVYQKSYAIIEAYFQDNEEDVVDTEAGGDVNQFQF